MTRTKISHYLSGQDWIISMDVWLFSKEIPKLIPDVSERLIEKNVHFPYFSFYPHFILMTRENGKNANEWMPSLICVVPEHNLVTWQASGTSGIAAPKKEETSAPLQAVAQFGCWFEGGSSQKSPVPLQNRGAGPTVGLITCCLHHGDLLFWAGITWNHENFHPHLRSTQWRIHPKKGTTTAPGSLQRDWDRSNLQKPHPGVETEPQAGCGREQKAEELTSSGTEVCPWTWRP